MLEYASRQRVCYILFIFCRHGIFFPQNNTYFDFAVRNLPRELAITYTFFLYYTLTVFLAIQLLATGSSKKNLHETTEQTRLAQPNRSSRGLQGTPIRFALFQSPSLVSLQLSQVTPRIWPV